MSYNHEQAREEYESDAYQAMLQIPEQLDEVNKNLKKIIKLLIMKK